MALDLLVGLYVVGAAASGWLTFDRDDELGMLATALAWPLVAGGFVALLGVGVVTEAWRAAQGRGL
jgi:hypothetical protein